MIPGMTAADARACGWTIGMTCLVIGLAMLAGWLLGCIGQALAGPDGAGAVPECPWCRKPRRFDAWDPRDCTCGEPCEAVWCQRHPVTGEVGDDIHRDGTPVSPGIEAEIEQLIRNYEGGDRG